jgi:hypothetical protein
MDARIFAIGLAASLAVGGCVVNRPDLAAQVFRCDTSSDCVDGWVCADISVLGDDVCRPACDPSRAAETCPNGFCTSSGACFDTCEIASDGDLERPCPSSLTCIRRRAESGDGLCVPAEGCSVTSECTGEHRDCANEVFGLPASVAGTTLSTDRLYCVDTPQGEAMDRCPNGSFAGGTTACIPSCDQEDDRCPPILTCLRGLGTLYGATGRSACIVGVIGMPCEDDSGCFLGRCLPLADGRRACTLTCAEASAASTAGCDSLDGYPLTGLGGLDFACDTIGACDRLGAVGAPCNADLPCHAGLTCSNSGAGVCTKECTTDADCSAGIPGLTNRTLLNQVYCARISDGSPLGLRFCLSRRPNGSACTESRECMSGLCSARVCRDQFP